MSEQGPGGPEQAQEQIQQLAAQLGPLLEVMQTAEDPKAKMEAIKKIMAILAQLKEIFTSIGAEAQYYENFGQLEMQMQQAMGQLEG